jgi:hypothetical protein
VPRVGADRPWLSSAILGTGYALAYLIMSWPQALHFRSLSWMDDSDGLVMLWNLWLAGEQGLNFWWTRLIFAPEGVPLLVHSYAPLKGWLGALLPLPLIPSLNLLVLLSFALAGTFTFWLARRFTANVFACVLAGYAFTFTGFHWSHATGHMNLLSTELIPLFALLWLRYEDRPTWARATGVAAALLATALTDYYFAFYCVGLGAILAVGRRMTWQDLTRVAVLVLPTTGALAMAVWMAAHGRDLLGAHDPATSPLDPFAMFVPGAHSWLAAYTEPVWRRFPGNPQELSVHFGLVLWAVIIWKARSRRWWAVLGIFTLLAMGEWLTVFGQRLPVPLPYQLLEWLLPPLELGGVPARMVVVAALAASVLFAIGVSRLEGRTRLLVALLLAIELAPSARPLTDIAPPGWVEALAAQPDSAPLYDPYSDPRWAMAWQTRHEHPISGGQIARTPASAFALNERRFAEFLGASPDPLVRAGFRYILIHEYAIGGAELIWRDHDWRLYRLEPPSP